MRARAAAATGLVMVATAAPLGSLAPLVAPPVWRPAALAALGAGAAAAFALRMMTRWIVWPTAIGALAGAGALLAWAAGGSGPGALAPWGGGVIDLVAAGARTIETAAPPITSGPGVGLIVGGVALVLYLSAEALAVGAGTPALAGVPLLGLWIPHLVMGGRPPVGLILLAAGAYVLLLAAAAVTSGPVAPAVMGVTAATVAASLILSPWALSAPSWIGGAGPSVGATRMDLGLDIRADLHRGADTPLMRYEGLTPTELGPVHSHTLAHFDGQAWHEADEETWLATTELHPEGVAPMADLTAPARTVTFTIDTLAQSRLFLPEAPRTAFSPLLYDPYADELYSPLGRGVSYELHGHPLIADPRAWHERATHTLPRDHHRYLDLPVTSKTPEIVALAEEITAGATSRYEAGARIQNYLRSTGHFEYTTTVPEGASDDAVWDFLQDGRGYCVQFATAMVILARAAGIPARMAVGFLPGERLGDGGVISAHDAHTWPQLFLGGAGWARFEPTPAQRAGAVPLHARGLAGGPGADADEEMPQSLPTQTAPASPPPGEAPTSGPDPGEGAAPGWVGLALALALVGGLLWWRAAGRAGGTRGRAGWGPEEYWREAIRALGPLGVTPEPRDTPRTLLDKARAAAGEESPEGGLRGLAHLTEAVNAARYSPDPGHYSAETLAAWLERVRGLAAAPADRRVHEEV